MIETVKLRYFKRFPDETFDLRDMVILAGPNNCGKSTLLQAISVWNLALKRWLIERGGTTPKAKARTGVPISRKDFTAIPLREMNLLWSDRDTALSKGEIDSTTKAGTPKLINIELTGRPHRGEQLTAWQLAIELRYASTEQVYVRPLDSQGNSPNSDTLEAAKAIDVVHVPPFSGIGSEETRYDLGYQNLLIGQAKPGDILRNLLLQIFQDKDESNWASLKDEISKIFRYTLIDPVYMPSSPYIVCEYTPSEGRGTRLDIASAGSGFHQVLLLLGFFYARPASILLLDEPDAHLHFILQREVFDTLRTIARKRDCQLVIATHSEVMIGDASPSNIVSFYRKPHLLDVDTEKDQVTEALKRLSSFDLLMAEGAAGILYVEDESSLKIMREFARVLNHPVSSFLNEPFVHAIHGRNPREARGHFFALKAIHPEKCGFLLLDGDNRNLPDREISADGLTLVRWQRYEIENYLLVPEALIRFVKGPADDLFSCARAKQAEEFLKSEFPPGAFLDPLGDHDYLKVTAASKTILPQLFNKVSMPISKKDYFLIAGQMEPGEIHPEVREKLDALAQAFGIPREDTDTAQ